VREYVLERDARVCVYCDAKDVPLNLDHVIAHSRGGSDRPSNLVCACIPCNQRKDSQLVQVFLAKQPKRLAKILARLKTPLRDAAAVNATRWELWRRLEETGLPVEASSGGRTKWNRHRLGVPKGHALDAASTGAVEALSGWRVPVLSIRCAGRGLHCRTRTDAHGFARLRLPRVKSVHGFRTGDLVLADVPVGKKQGRYLGRVAVRSTGSFNIQTGSLTVQGISWRRCKVVQRDDGYAYTPNQRKGGIPPIP
jgi:hypothetical protein